MPDMTFGSVPDWVRPKTYEELMGQVVERELHKYELTLDGSFMVSVEAATDAEAKEKARDVELDWDTWVPDDSGWQFYNKDGEEYDESEAQA